MKLTQNAFSTFELTSEELFAATSFTALQKAFFQNQLAEAAEEKLRLQFKDENKQYEAELSGRILLLEWLIALEPIKPETTDNEPL